MKHADVPSGFIHTPFQWIFADATAREAAADFGPGDVNKIALEIDTATIWRVSDVDGSGVPTWVALNLTAFPPAGDSSMGGHRLTSVGDATADTDALNRRTADSRYDPIGAAAGTSSGQAAGGDLSGTFPRPTVAKVLDGKTPLTADRNLGDVASVATARTNLGLGSAATQPASAFDPAGAAGSAASAAQAAAEAASDAAGAASAAQAAAEAASDPAGAAAIAEAAAIAAVEGWAAQGLTPTAVQTTDQTLTAGQALRTDISGGSTANKLPNAPPDKTRCAIKIVNVSGTPGSTQATLSTQGADHFNTATGSTTLTFTALFQGAVVQYSASDKVWVVQATDTPLGSALGAAKLGSDGTVGGPSGSPLNGAITMSAHGLLGDRPAANGSRGLYYATDDGPNGTTYLDTGSWQAVGSGFEVAYAEVVTNYALPNSLTAVPGLAVGPFAVGSRPIMVELNIPYIAGASGGAGNPTVSAGIYEGATERTICVRAPDSANNAGPLVLQYRCAPNSGSRSFAAKMQSSAGGTVEAAQPAPMFLRAWQL